MAEIDRLAIKQRLKQAREEAGLKQPELADLLTNRDGDRLHWRSVQNYESMKNRRVPFDMLDQWARATAVTKEWLLHGEEAHGLIQDERLSLLEGQVAGARADLSRILALLESS